MWDLVVLHLYFQRRLTLGSVGNQVSETKQVELLQPAGRGLTGMKRSLTFLSFECPDDKGGNRSWAISHLPFGSCSCLAFHSLHCLGTVGVSLGYIWTHTWVF